MINNLKNCLLTICGLLEKHKLQYIIIGGTAVALNSYYRLTINNAGEPTNKPDIDIWYNPNYNNYFNILKVIEELGEDITDFKNEPDPNPHKSFFKLDFNEFSLDILPEIKSSTKFLAAYRRKETVILQDVPIHFMNYSDLIEDKMATARKKDLQDIAELKKIKGEE
jgi:hypothetical protein